MAPHPRVSVEQCESTLQLSFFSEAFDQLSFCETLTASIVNSYSVA